MAKRQVSRINCLLGIDKPQGMTSHDVVARVRRALGERRVGHAGTLDPMATGVMVVGIGQATRLLGLLTLDTKAYVAEISFGAETNTDDLEGTVTREAAVPAEVGDADFAREVLAGMHGVQDQVPPAFSAISVEGVRSYRRARAGEEVALPPRRIEVIDALLLGVGAGPRGPVWTVAFTVSKGTYIRALARDLGRRVGSAAHLTALRRTASGSIGLGQCLALDAVEPAGALRGALDPRGGARCVGAAAPGVARGGCPERPPSAVGRRRARATPLPAPEQRIALVADGAVAALAHVDAQTLRARPRLSATNRRCSPLMPDRSELVRDFMLESGGAPLYRLDDSARSAVLPPAAIAIGAFDGMHRGHADLIARTVADARERGVAAYAVTFDPDPDRVVASEPVPHLLAMEDRWRLLAASGVDGIVVIPFTPELARLDHAAFFERVLLPHVPLVSVHVGSDFRLGAGGASTVDTMRAWFRPRGIAMYGHDPRVR